MWFLFLAGRHNLPLGKTGLRGASVSNRDAVEAGLVMIIDAPGREFLVNTIITRSHPNNILCSYSIAATLPTALTLVTATYLSVVPVTFSRVVSRAATSVKRPFDDV